MNEPIIIPYKTWVDNIKSVNELELGYDINTCTYCDGEGGYYCDDELKCACEECDGTGILDTSSEKYSINISIAAYKIQCTLDICKWIEYHKPQLKEVIL